MLWLLLFGNKIVSHVVFSPPKRIKHKNNLNCRIFALFSPPLGCVIGMGSRIADTGASTPLHVTFLLSTVVKLLLTLLQNEWRKGRYMKGFFFRWVRAKWFNAQNHISSGMHEQEMISCLFFPSIRRFASVPFSPFIPLKNKNRNPYCCILHNLPKLAFFPLSLLLTHSLVPFDEMNKTFSRREVSGKILAIATIRY
jgi:hypothetical protein